MLPQTGTQLARVTVGWATSTHSSAEVPPLERLPRFPVKWKQVLHFIKRCRHFKAALGLLKCWRGSYPRLPHQYPVRTGTGGGFTASERPFATSRPNRSGFRRVSCFRRHARFNPTRAHWKAPFPVRDTPLCRSRRNADQRGPRCGRRFNRPYQNCNCSWDVSRPALPRHIAAMDGVSLCTPIKS